MSCARPGDGWPTKSVQQLATALVGWFADDTEYAIALSGGVDSAVVARAATLAGARCHAVTAIGPAVSARELQDAREIARCVGIEHHWIDADELADVRYRTNDARRCFHCKTNLFAAVRARFPGATIVTGTNRDDLGDYRPGLEAARNAAVRAPLAELGIGKVQVRQLARWWHLAIANKPASPCLASRIAYGVEVTEERLRRIDAAEQLLRQLGAQDCRVRLHADELARIEVPQSDLARLLQEPVRQQIVDGLLGLGFRFVAIDLQPLRSGSLNQVLVPLPT
ncbi:MAG: ATP-dependent sacrificial sulfur transferase LarE [Planctomycetota bacterium]|nr:MAG: ATP-dependent sacrificial sulfur transferase LarE [Planctomycetota bacterium]